MSLLIRLWACLAIAGCGLSRNQVGVLLVVIGVLVVWAVIRLWVGRSKRGRWS